MSETRNSPANSPAGNSPLGAASQGESRRGLDGGLTLAEFQELIRRMYLRKDQIRGVAGTYMWLMEEIGELAASLRDGTHEEQVEEFADVLAWLTTIANVAGVDLTEAVMRKYGRGCPGCGEMICTCADAEKP